MPTPPPVPPSASRPAPPAASLRSEPRKSVLIGIALVLAALVWSGLHPFDRSTWWMEIVPVLIVLPVLVLGRNRWPLTTLVCICLCVHALILILGGAYSYARVPLGFWIADWLHLSRNPYDKIGHFAQGFVPALLAREILIRGSYVQGRKMLAFLVLCIALAVSAIYELIEWGAALALGQGADEFLGTQGDPFDTQSDIFFALIGAAVALLLFSRLHDRQIERAMQRERLAGLR